MIIEEPVVSNSSGKYYKRVQGDNFLRCYPFSIKVDGKSDEKFGKVKVSHWIEGKNFPCSGKNCKLCEDGNARSRRMTIAVVNRDVKDAPMQYWDAPTSVYNSIWGVIKTNGEDFILGDAGSTINVNYNPEKSGRDKYSVTPLLKDKEVLSYNDKLLPYNDSDSGEVKIDLPETKIEIDLG